MKSRNIASRVFAFAVAAFMLSTPLTTTVSANTQVSTTDIVAQAKGAPVAPAPAPAAVQFDGKKLYKEVFEHLRDRHITLSDPAARAKWAAEWENKHANDKALDTEESTDKAVYEMIQSLGQRFDYYNPPERNKAEREQFDATLVGIGAQLKLKGQAEAILAARKLGPKPDPEALKKIFEPFKTVSDAAPIIVEEPMEGGPAEKAGIKKGDRITKVDGVDVNGKSLDAVVKTIRGKENTVVKITVVRDDGKGGVVEQTIDITRGKVVSKVTKVKDLGNGLTYIKLNDWSSRFVEKEMYEALTNAAKGKGIVIDLRGNPGGRLDAVNTVGQFLLKEGTLLTMKERRGDAMVETKTVLQPEFALQLLKSTAQPGKIGMGSGEREDLIIPEDMPIVVLIDEGSASASEILSGLLQANKRAIIVGKTSHGKGVGQQVIPLSYDRNIHVTTFEFLPGGVAMDWVGVIPDIEVTNPDEVIVDPTKDLQLEAAKKALQDAVSKAAAHAKKSEDTLKANKDAFQKERDEAAKKAGDKGAAPAPTK
jgi:carboxyl-terminal processing protease